MSLRFRPRLDVMEQRETPTGFPVDPGMPPEPPPPTDSPPPADQSTPPTGPMQFPPPPCPPPDW